MVNRKLRWALFGVLATALAAPAAVAQPKKAKGDKKHRKGKVDAPQVRGMNPTSGAAGTIVRIRARGVPADAKVRIGKRRVPAQVKKNHVTFTVPMMKPGKRPVMIRYGAARVPVGQFEVLPGGVPPAADQPPAPARSAPRPLGFKHTGPPTRVGRRDHRQPGAERWKRYRQGMLVSGYAPRMGPAGTKVTIYGRNFDDGAVVRIGGQAVAPTKVKKRKIVFVVPPGTKDGMIRVVNKGQRPLVVGAFDFKKKARSKKEWKKLRKARKDAAEKRWQEHVKTVPPKKKARRAWLLQREAELQKTRQARRQAALARARAKWKRKFLSNPEVQAEMTLHSTRLARLNRMKRLATADDRAKLAIRVEVLIDRENNRHNRRMAALKIGIAAK